MTRSGAAAADDILYAGNGDDRSTPVPDGDLIVGLRAATYCSVAPVADAFLVFPDDSRPDFDPTEDILLDLPTALLHLFAR